MIRPKDVVAITARVVVIARTVIATGQFVNYGCRIWGKLFYAWFAMPEVKWPELAEWLTTMMGHEHMSARAVGKYAGVKHTTIETWKTGFRRPSYDNCGRLAQVFKADPIFVRKLVGYHEEPKAAEEERCARTGDEWAALRAFRASQNDPLLLGLLRGVVETALRDTGLEPSEAFA